MKCGISLHQLKAKAFMQYAILCKRQFSYKTSHSNLKKHITCSHPTISISTPKIQKRPSPLLSTIDGTRSTSAALNLESLELTSAASTSSLRPIEQQQKLTAYLPKKNRCICC